MARIVTLGSALQDIYLIDRDDLEATEIGDSAIFGKVLVGSKVDIDKISFEIGGGGVNSAVSFARHGHEAIFIGNIGKDPAGNAVLRLLDDEDVDSSHVSYAKGRTTGTSIVLLDTRSGERTILTCRGASVKFDNLDANELDMIHPDWIYVTTLRGDVKTLRAFFEKAKTLGTKIMFNPGVCELQKPRELIQLLSYVDILLVNKSEAAQIVPGVLLEELLYHLGNYANIVIITDGAMGGIAGNHQEIYRFGIYEDKKVKDATGAGDAFGSGFLAHYASGKSFRDSLIFASANSTAVVSQIGANHGILSGTEKLHPMPIQKI